MNLVLEQQKSKMDNNGIVVLISGRGSNLQAICEAGLDTQIKCVISNQANAKGLLVASKFGIQTEIIEHEFYKTREEFDTALLLTINKYQPKLVVLAGFMRILTSTFINQYTNKIINIHPSILPSFVGANAIIDTINAHVKIAGTTVHYVTEHLDNGPIIAQGIIRINNNDTTDQLSQRILCLEHVIYPFVIKKILNNHVRIIKTKVIVDMSPDDNKALGKYYPYIYY